MNNVVLVQTHDLIVNRYLPLAIGNIWVYAHQSEYVRKNKTMTLMDAIRKSSLMPAQRLEKRAPDFLRKGRLKVGADADICIFDPVRVVDNSTYSNPSATSTGFNYVLVNGVPLVTEGVIKDNMLPGKPARAPIV